MPAQRKKRTYGSVGKFIRRLRKPKPDLRIFDPAEAAPLPVSEDELNSKQFFCVRGFMKSGTNWVSNLLNLHPEVSCVGEFHWHHVQHAFATMTSRLDWLSEPGFQKSEFEKQIEQLMQRTILLRADRSKTWIGDRTPCMLEPISFPNAPHIHIKRDGRDVLISRAFHLFNRLDNEFVKHEIANDKVLSKQVELYKADPDYFVANPRKLLQSESVVRRTGRTWRQFMVEDRTTMEKHPQLKILSVKYEDLHQATEQIRNEMLEFLGANPETSRDLDETTKPGFASSEDSFYRKGKVGDWKNYMTEEARQWFIDEAGDELITQGYARTHHW